VENAVDIIQHIKSQKQSFAEAFPNITYHEYPYGFVFEWSNSDHYLTNFTMVTSSPDNQVDEITKWLKNDSTRKITVKDGLQNLFSHLEIQFELGMFYRPKSKISSPILSDTGVKFISYRSMSKDSNLQDSINVFTEIENIPENEKAEFHRLLGGHMHLFEGVIWTLDKDGSVLTTGLTSNLEGINDFKFIDLLSTRETVREQGHGSALLQSILAYNKNESFITLVKKSKAAEKLLLSFNFKEIMTFTVFK
jgi:hypothetical protein